MEGFFRYVFALFVTIMILKKSYAKKSLSRSGCFAAFFVGFFVSSANLCQFVSLLTFFYVCNKATRYCQKEKQRLDPEGSEGAQRGAIQVLSNGSVATLFSVLYLTECGSGERVIDFVSHYNASWYTLAVLASLSCSCGDTLASELGPVLFNKSNKWAFHIVQWKRVPKGTNGGISFFGTLASILGGFLVGLAYYLALKLAIYFHAIVLAFFFLRLDDHELTVPQWPILLIGSFSGFFGSIIDSLLGGYFQYSGLDKKTHRIVESPGPGVEHISGYKVLSNNQVNLLSCFITSIIVPYWSFGLYKNWQL